MKTKRQLHYHQLFKSVVNLLSANENKLYFSMDQISMTKEALEHSNSLLDLIFFLLVVAKFFTDSHQSQVYFDSIPIILFRFVKKNGIFCRMICYEKFSIPNLYQKRKTSLFEKFIVIEKKHSKFFMHIDYPI